MTQQIVAMQQTKVWTNIPLDFHYHNQWSLKLKYHKIQNFAKTTHDVYMQHSFNPDCDKKCPSKPHNDTNWYCNILLRNKFHFFK